MLNFKEYIRGQLARRGWFLRRIPSLPAGVILEHDFLTTAQLPEPRVVIDAGAHHGETAERFARAFPRARIFSFEPVSANFAVLAENARRWPSVACHQLALSDRTGEATIVLQRDSETHSLEPRTDATSSAGHQLETIRLTKLDEFAATQQLENIDLLKIDTEGHELAVFNGARDLLTRRRIGAILIEASLDPADTVHTSLLAASAVLRPFGFELAALYDQVLWRNPTKLAYFNALFVSTSPDRSSHGPA